MSSSEPDHIEQNQDGPNRNRGIRHVEGRKSDLLPTALFHVEVEKIDDMFDRQPVNQVSNDAAEDKAQGELASEPSGVKVMAAEKQDEQGDQSHYREQFVVTREQTPGRSGVPPMDKFEKTVDYYLLPVIPQESEHETFGGLI